MRAFVCFSLSHSCLLASKLLLFDAPTPRPEPWPRNTLLPRQATSPAVDLRWLEFKKAISRRDPRFGSCTNYSGNSSNPRPFSCTNLLCATFISASLARIE